MLRHIIEDHWQDEVALVRDREDAKKAVRQAAGLNAGKVKRLQNSNRDVSHADLERAAREIARQEFVRHLK